MNSSRTLSRRGGFTLVELITSLVITSILMLGLSSVMLIGSKAVPSGTEQIHAEAACARVLEDMADDLTLAWGITLASKQDIIIGVLDRDGDGGKDQIRYTYDSDAATIKKTWNSEKPVTVLSNVSAFSVTLTTSDGTGSAALIELSMSSITSPAQNTRVELYNYPEVR